MSYFREARNTELSTITYLEAQINASWTGVSVVKGFDQVTERDLPVVCIRLLDTNSDRQEIGATTLSNRYGFNIDIFARSDGQRIDLADFIRDQLKDTWIYYAYSQVSGDPTNIFGTASGRLRVVEFTENSRVEFGEEVERKDKYRHILSFVVRRSLTS
jgi:hypothetical protein